MPLSSFTLYMSLNVYVNVNFHICKQQPQLSMMIFEMDNSKSAATVIILKRQNEFNAESLSIYR